MRIPKDGGAQGWEPKGREGQGWWSPKKVELQGTRSHKAGEPKPG